MKKIIILENDGGELGNQLWNYVSVWAYARERGVQCENWSFFEYEQYFAHLRPQSVVARLFVLSFSGYAKRRDAFRARLMRRLYKVYVQAVRALRSGRILFSAPAPNQVFYLPPTIPATPTLQKLEEMSDTVYFSQISGGVFRNPHGLEIHAATVREHFAPAKTVADAAATLLVPLRKQYRHTVGVHLRQGDYKDFKGGKFQISQLRVREILEEYLRESGRKSDDICFVITSDSPVDPTIFSGLAVIVSNGSVGEDLFALAACDVVIGSDSTFGYFAAWYGNIPHIVMKNEGMDWEYYRGNKTFFVNKYLTVMLQ